MARLSEVEGRAVFDEKARALLGISGDEFLRRLDAGDYDGIDEDGTGRKVGRLLVALPLVQAMPNGG